MGEWRIRAGLGEWRMRTEGGGMENESGAGGASLTPDYRDIEVSVPASPRTTGIKRYRCQPHPGLQG